MRTEAESLAAEVDGIRIDSISVKDMESSYPYDAVCKLSQVLKGLDFGDLDGDEQEFRNVKTALQQFVAAFNTQVPNHGLDLSFAGQGSEIQFSGDILVALEHYVAGTSSTAERQELSEEFNRRPEPFSGGTGGRSQEPFAWQRADHPEPVGAGVDLSGAIEASDRFEVSPQLEVDLNLSALVRAGYANADGTLTSKVGPIPISKLIEAMPNVQLVGNEVVPPFMVDGQLVATRQDAVGGARVRIYRGQQLSFNVAPVANVGSEQPVVLPVAPEVAFVAESPSHAEISLRTANIIGGDGHIRQSDVGVERFMEVAGVVFDTNGNLNYPFAVDGTVYRNRADLEGVQTFGARDGKVSFEVGDAETAEVQDRTLLIQDSFRKYLKSDVDWSELNAGLDLATVKADIETRIQMAHADITDPLPAIDAGQGVIPRPGRGISVHDARQIARQVKALYGVNILQASAERNPVQLRTVEAPVERDFSPLVTTHKESPADSMEAVLMRHGLTSIIGNYNQQTADGLKSVPSPAAAYMNNEGVLNGLANALSLADLIEKMPFNEITPEGFIKEPFAIVKPNGQRFLISRQQHVEGPNRVRISAGDRIVTGLNKKERNRVNREESEAATVKRENSRVEFWREQQDRATELETENPRLVSLIESATRGKVSVTRADLATMLLDRWDGKGMNKIPANAEGLEMQIDPEGASGNAVSVTWTSGDKTQWGKRFARFSHQRDFNSDASAYLRGKYEYRLSWY